MWLSCSAFFAKHPQWMCPVGLGEHLDPQGNFVRYAHAKEWYTVLVKGFKPHLHGLFYRLIGIASVYVSKLYPTSQLSHGENSPHRSGLPGQADRVTRLGGIPHLTCERDQEKKKDCMDRLNTPPGRGTSPA